MVIRPNLFGFDLFLSIERLDETIISNSLGTLIEKYHMRMFPILGHAKVKVVNCSLLCYNLQYAHALVFWIF